MSLKNLLKIAVCLSMLLATTAIVGAPVSARKVMQGPPIGFMEEVIVTVNCSEASITAVISFMTSDPALVHYPSEVNMTDSHFELCESIFVVATQAGSALICIFATSDTGAAVAHAEAIRPFIGTAFDLTLPSPPTYVEPIDGKTNVTYVAQPIPNILAYYTAVLNPKCLRPDLAGFSNAIPNLLNVQPSKAYAGISASKASGSYDWQYIFFAGCFEMQIPLGSGYTVDVLNLIGASSLTPSSYANTGAYYNSIVPVYVTSHLPVSFVSCNPGPPLMVPDPTTRGWYIMGGPPTLLTSMFYIGNDTAPVTVLTFTFSGAIVPEFSSLTLIIAMIVCTIGIIASKKRFLKISNKHAPSLQ